MSGEFDTEGTMFIKCPYCGYEDSDSWEIFAGERDGDEAKIECGKCERTFEVTLHVDISYSTKKVENEVSK